VLRRLAHAPERTRIESSFGESPFLPSGLSNTRGGVVILGLDEGSGFAPAGLLNPAKIAADLGSMCSSEMEPPLRPLIGIHQFEGEQVVVAEIPGLDPAQRPCFYIGAGMTKGSFVRVSDGDRRLSSYEVQVMLSSRGQPRDDEQAVPGAMIEDLVLASVDALVARLRTSRPRTFRCQARPGPSARTADLASAPCSTHCSPQA
jgi:ATP-dependent DNA helicase RecG